MGRDPIDCRQGRLFAGDLLSRPDVEPTLRTQVLGWLAQPVPPEIDPL